jgi:hypothetical protein
VFVPKDRRFIDDLPFVSISRLRATGVITVETTEFLVKLGDAEQVFGVTLRKFPCGGSYSFFACGCGRRARVLRLLNGAIMCCLCCISRGVRYRCEPTGSSKRAALRIPKLIAMLESKESLRLKPVLYGTMERRARHEAALQRNLMILKRHDLAALAKAIDKAEE